MSFKTINASVKKINLINQTNNYPKNYEIQEPEIDYSDKNLSVVSYISKFFNHKEEDTNSKVVKDDYVINLGFTKIDLEQELEKALSNMPFEVVLTDEDKYKLLDIISKRPLAFVPLTKNNIKIEDIIGIIKYLDKKMDISYDKLSKMVPDLNNVVKGYLDPVIKDIITIDYDNIGLLWDAYLSSNKSELKKAIDQVCPNVANELSSYVYKNFGVVIDPEEIDYTSVISNSIADLEDVLEDFEECKTLISGNILDKAEGVKKIVELLNDIGIPIVDMAHVAYDTTTTAISNGATEIIGNIPLAGDFLLDVGENISDGYDFIAENSAKVPFVGPSINYILTTDPIDKLEDAYNVGADIVSGIKSIFGW